MIDIGNIYVEGFSPAIEGMRNPLNSWDKSDSEYIVHDYVASDKMIDRYEVAEVGPADMDLMKRLFNAGTEHRKFMRFIDVWMTVKAPIYWWKEADTYHFMDRNSCSTMHTITKKWFEMTDFAVEHLNGEAIPAMNKMIWTLNRLREEWFEAEGDRKKEIWYSIIQLLPSSYLQQSTIKFNYETAANIYRQRKNHKLDEWHIFCDTLECLPYFKDITGIGGDLHG